MAALSREIYGRMVTLERFVPGASMPWWPTWPTSSPGSAAWPTARRTLQGVIEFYQTRTNTKMTIAAERLAVIAAVTLPGCASPRSTA